MNQRSFDWAVWCVALALVAACDGSARREVTPGDGTDEPPGEGASPDEILTSPIPNLGPCALQLNEVALYQAVKIPLAVTDAAGSLVAAPGRNADVVAGRPALFRVFATPTPGWQGTATARLTLTSSRGARRFYSANDLAEPASDLTYSTTFNFRVPGDAIAADTTWRVDVVSPASCGRLNETQFPVANALALAPRVTGIVKVMLVPVEFNFDASGRLPDVSEAQIQRYRDLLMSMYPVTAAEITVREPVRTDVRVTAQEGWEALLDSLRVLRQEDGAAADVHYYGIINPAASFTSYCGRTKCTAGIAYVSKNREAALRVGVGVGFTGQFAAQTLAHELGHQHGRIHSPCNVDGDRDYPYERGAVGVWGYDSANQRLIDPSSFSDVMGYCSPQWVSDFTYQGLLEYLAVLQSTPTVQALRLPQTWKVLLVAGNGRARWGHPLTTSEDPAGTPETARVFDEAGHQVAAPTVYRTAIGDSDTAMLWVPAPEASWASVAVNGAQAHRFDAPVTTSRLR